jgi:hypothetical protein
VGGVDPGQHDIVLAMRRMEVEALADATRLKDEIAALSKHEGPIFIGFAMSSWHAAGLDSWIRARHAEDPRMAGLVLLVPHRVNGLLITDKDFPFAGQVASVSFRVTPRGGGRDGILPKELRYLGRALLSMASSCLRRGVSRGLPVSFLSPHRVARAWGLFSDHAGLFRGRTARFVLLDEGVGTYASLRHWVKVLVREARASGTRRSVLPTVVALVGNSVLETAIGAAFVVERRFLLAPNGSVLDLHPTVVRELAAYFRDHGDLPLELAEMKSPRAVFVSQPFSELGVLPVRVEAEMVTAAVRALMATGFNVIVVLHPREELGKFGKELDCSDGHIRVAKLHRSIEFALSRLDESDVVVGLSSTSLLTASALFGMRAFECATPRGMEDRVLVSASKMSPAFIRVWRRHVGRSGEFEATSFTPTSPTPTAGSQQGASRAGPAEPR